MIPPLFGHAPMNGSDRFQAITDGLSNIAAFSDRVKGVGGFNDTGNRYSSGNFVGGVTGPPKGA